MAVSLVMVGTSLGQAVPVGQTTTAAQTTAAPVPAIEASGGTITGTVKAGAVPLPGVGVTATNTLTGKKYATTTDVNGSFTMAIPRNGRYVVKAELAAFATETKEVLINAAGENGGKPAQVAEFGLQLASRVQQQEARQAAATSSAGIARGVQALSVTGDGVEVSDAGANASAGAENTGSQMPSLAGVGGDAAAADSVTVNGAMGQTNGLAGYSEDDIRQRVQDAIAQAQRQGGAAGDMANVVVGMLGGMMGGGGGFGGPGGGGGGGGGRGGRGGGGGGGGGGFRGFNPTQPHGAVFFQGGNGALDATNFSLTGTPVVKPAYSTNRFGLSFTGSPSIPGLVKASTKQFVFLNVTGQRNITPTNLYGTVPTDGTNGTHDQRAGDFSGLTQTVNGVTMPVTLYDPTTGQPFKNNQVPVSPQAAALLKYYPAPNIAPTGRQGYNYQTITTAGNNAATAALRYVRNFGQSSGFGGGRRQAANAPKTLRQNINFNGSYSHTAADNRNIFLPLGGATETGGYGVTAGYTIGYGRLTNNASINWNRSHSMARNYFTDISDPLAGTGISVPKPVIGGNPGIYFGLPSVSISNFTSLNQALPNDGINQTISFSDFVSYSHKRHNMRFGVDIRRVHADSIGGTNVVGGFTFTGYATQNPATVSACTPSSTVKCPVVAPSGFGFADFLLGRPQQSTIQAAQQKTYLRANVFDWYAQDDWRMRANLTLNFGLRYEYFSPYVEKDNRLVNLDHNADFTQVSPVCPVAVPGACAAGSPRSLVNPDRNMYSPRFGFAYRPKQKIFKETVIRGGYGINFNTGQYSSFASQLSAQTPFALTQTNIVGQPGCTPGVLTLANGFGCSTTPVQNNYAVNRLYRLGHVQVWNLDVQRTLPMGVVMNIGYNGAQGGDLDILRAPNRTANGASDTRAQPFNYEDSLGYSRFEQLSVNVRKRLQKGVSVQATYHYGHSIDNASSIGGGKPTVAQNDQDLNAEEGNSSFDVRHQVTGNWVLELPFGPNRAYFTKGGFWSKALDGFSFSGDFTFATGTYYTPHYVSTVAETATGSNNSLRPDRVLSQPVTGAGTVLDWFNKAAFATPANGFGTASRGSIEGPGIVAVDASLSRTVGLGETRSFEARVTANNVFNTVQYSGIDTTLNSQTFGQVTSTATMRRFTVLARYRF
jgi:trimeric autotransporter adhesin